MNNFREGGFKKRGADFGGRSKFGGGKPFGGSKRPGGGFGGRDRVAAEMFSATCTSCGKNCEVPFCPTGDRPVLCKDCFGKKNGDDRDSGQGSYRSREAVRPARSEYGRPEQVRSTEVPRQAHDTAMANVLRQLSTIESRLNRILDIINPPMPAAKAVVAPVLTAIDGVPVIKKQRKPKTVAAKKPAKKAKK